MKKLLYACLCMLFIAFGASSCTTVKVQHRHPHEKVDHSHKHRKPHKKKSTPPGHAKKATGSKSAKHYAPGRNK